MEVLDSSSASYASPAVPPTSELEVKVDIPIEQQTSSISSATSPPETPVSLSAAGTQVDLPVKKQLKQTIPIQLEWKDVSYTVTMREKIFKRHQRQILQPMSGFVAPGQVLAIMGPSGAGKTSLLNILAQRVRNYQGTLLVNGEKITKNYRAVAAFVQQDDVLMGNLTPYEILFYAAMLRLPSGISLSEKKARVFEVIDELGLRKCMNTRVGVPGIVKGLSGGERKRLAIAVELITGPSILFLDEPTTGLDSKTALNLMELLNTLAKRGRTIVLTIHQPRSDIFQLFDKLLLLSRGQVAYFGKALEVTNYFGQLGHKCPPEYNPADFFIDLVAEWGDREKDDARILPILAKYKENRQLHEQVPPFQGDTDALKKFSTYSSWFIVQLFVIFLRSFINILRDRILTMSRLFQTIAMSLLVGLIYLQIKDNQKSIQDRAGAIFFILINNAMNSVFTSGAVSPAELGVFMRERSSKTYRVSAYYLGKTLAELPTQIFFPLLYTAIGYWMIGLNKLFERFVLFFVVLFVTTITASSFGQLIATVAPKPDVSMAITPVIVTISMLFSGFYINIENIPVYFVWIYWISFFHYSFEALILNEFTGAKFSCLESEYIVTSAGKVCPITKGEQVINNLKMTNALSAVWIDILMLLALMLIFKFLTFLALRFLKKPRGGG